MFASTLLVVLFGSVFTAASFARSPSSLVRTCGSNPTVEKRAEWEEDFAKRRVLLSKRQSNTTIPVWFHVISLDGTVGGGDVPASQISDQISVLNADYSASGISWTLVNTTRTVNSTWYDIPSASGPEQTEMKAALRQGGPETLNVYAVGTIVDSGDNLLGYATFPADYTNAPADDGVVLLSSSLPGGTGTPFNLGRTLTHEAGHWVGLYHTFQGGCSDPGDYVADTPPEAKPVYGCPATSDTCLTDTLPDDFHNYMDYTDDSCMTHFTPGQGTRLQDQIATYR